MTAAARAAIAIAVAIAGCSPDRRSADYECTSDTDCDPARRCDRGYCVERTTEPPADGANCPSQCDACDPVAKTCLIDCPTADSCNNVRCPDGYLCAIQCRAIGACGSVNCNTARACAIECTAPSACESITCGNGVACDITCAGANACPDIDCKNACSCDVECNNTGCDFLACPRAGAIHCTVGGSPSAACDSSFDPACSTCVP